MKESLLLEIINSIPVNIYWKGPDSRLAGCNLQQAQFLGYSSPEELIGKSDYDFYDKELAEKIVSFDKEIMEKNKIYRSEEVVQNKDGDERVMFSIKKPMTVDSQKWLVGISIDITENAELKKLLESKNAELQEMLRRYEDFVSNQEHDMITPYSGILGASDVVLDMFEEDDLDKDEMRMFVEGIHKSSEALLNYQRSLLDAIYLFTDENELYSRRFNIHELLCSIQDIYLCSVQENNLNFKVTVAQDIPDFLIGDSFRLQKILIHLISNAIKYTPKDGKIHLRCDYKPQADNVIVLDVQVEDTGVGIEGDKLAVIFEPFVRLSLSNIGKYTGRGVGLAFVKKMVEELQGEIDVTSELGKGSVFRLLVPMRVSLSQDETPKPGKLLNSK